MLKQTGILRVKAEYQPDAKNIQAFEGFFAFWVMVLLQKCIIDFANEFARFL